MNGTSPAIIRLELQEKKKVLMRTKIYYSLKAIPCWKIPTCKLREKKSIGQSIEFNIVFNGNFCFRFTRLYFSNYSFFSCRNG